MKNIYVGNLNVRTTNDTLRTAFAMFGNVHSVNMAPGRSFGFVEMINDTEGAAAIDAMAGKMLDGNSLTVQEARPRPERR